MEEGDQNGQSERRFGNYIIYDLWVEGFNVICGEDLYRYNVFVFKYLKGFYIGK